MIPSVKDNFFVGERLDARDNRFTERSPCIGCEHEYHDKNDCLDTCERLKACQAYQPIPQVSKSISSIISANEAKLKLLEWPTAKTGRKPIAPKLAKQRQPAEIKPKTILKPVQPKLVKHHEPRKCLICGRPETKKRKIQRGLCKTQCYAGWQKGKFLHPEFGVFVRLTREEIANDRAKDFKECLIPGCKAVGNKRKLCMRHYYRWYHGRIRHPEYGDFNKVFGVKR